MGFMLQLILGLFVLQACGGIESTVQAPGQEVVGTTTAKNGAVDAVSSNRISQIVKPKTEDANSTTNSPKETPNTKLSQSEPYRRNVLDKSKDDGNQNSIKAESAEQREDKSIDISKYVSPDFHNESNVYKLPNSPENEKFIDNDFHDYHTTSKNDRAKISFKTELTTPKSELFDRKYQETVENVDQTLNHIETKSFETSTELNVEKLVEDVKDQYKESSLDYKKVKNIIVDQEKNKTSKHGDLIVEEGTNLNFESAFNKSISYEDGEGDDKFNKIVPKLREEDSLEEKSDSVTIRMDPTTRKSVTLTKPPVDRNNSYILNNKIETDTIKAIRAEINTSTTSSTTNTYSSSTSKKVTSSRGTIKYADYAPTTAHPRILLKSKDKIKAKNNGSEQVVQENQVISVQVEPPQTEKNDTEEELNLTTSSNLLLNFLSGKSNETSNFTTDPDGVIKTFDNEAGISDSSNFEITGSNSEDVTETSTIENETTSIIPEEASQTTEITTDSQTEETTTVSTNTSTEKEKNNYVRTSKQAVITTESLTTTEIITESTTMDQETTTFENTTIEETTVNFNDTTTVDVPTTTEIKEEAISIIPTTIMTTPAPANKSSTSPTTTVSNFITTFHPVNNSDNFEEQPSTTEFAFVHIEKVGNHTTMFPEVIKPSFNYSTPVVIDNNARNVDLDIKTTSEETSSPTITTKTTTTETQSTFAPPTEDPRGPEENGSKGTIIAIVISTVGGVCLIILAGLLYLMRKRQKRFNYGQRCRPVSLDDYSMDNVSAYNSVRRKGMLRASKRSYGNPAFDDPVAVQHPLNFPALAKFALNQEDIRAEFEEIPQITARTNELPEGCETKNRYANVIPLPETRVFLTPIDGYPNSDYINANYVTGPKNAKGYYIACQAPLQNTVDDFWRMIWEQNSKVILMITNLYENGVEKCVDYLPPSEVLDCNRLFGDYQVTLKKREVKEKYIISNLQLKNMVSNSWREVTHFWYLGWPEKGVPSEANSLIAFLIEARSCMKTSSLDKRVQNGQNGNLDNGTEMNPVVVHCSPGTGRTGVVITCDIAIREFEKSRLVDIPRIVYRIRRDRASSVQTKEQYEFIYKVVSLYATKLTGGGLDSI